MPADLILFGGNVLTMNPKQPFAEAVAVRKGIIIKVGSNDDTRQLIGKRTKVVHMNGKTVVPGFIDTHIHVVDFGRFLTWVALHDVDSIREMQSRIKNRVLKHPGGKWIIGRGWDQNRFVEKRFPTRYDLDICSPDNPVILFHQSGQICIVNSKALELAGVTRQTTPPLGGTFDKNEKTGELTGILRDTAMDLVWDKVPEPLEEELVQDAYLACKEILKVGITSVHWMILSQREFGIMQQLWAQNRLLLRVYPITPANLLDLIDSRYVRNSKNNTALKIGGAMIFADGYLAARTAALFQSYTDYAGSSGKLLCTQQQMNKLARSVRKANLQLILHAVGDKAIDAALSTIEKISKDPIEKKTRDRIEQAAVLNETLLKRMVKQQVIVSVQPRVIDSEFVVWSAAERLGPDRVRWLYPLKTLISRGIVVSGGSDCPMEPLSPLTGIQTAVTRSAFPEERITVEEALCLYTSNAAYASSEENVKGSIEESKLADLTVLSRDPLKVTPNKIGDIEVEMTILGGRIVYSKN